MRIWLVTTDTDAGVKYEAFRSSEQASARIDAIRKLLMRRTVNDHGFAKIEGPTSSDVEYQMLNCVKITELDLS